MTNAERICEDKHGLVMLGILDMDGYEQNNRVYGSGGGYRLH